MRGRSLGRQGVLHPTNSVCKCNRFNEDCKGRGEVVRSSFNINSINVIRSSFTKLIWPVDRLKDRKVPSLSPGQGDLVNKV